MSGGISALSDDELLQMLGQAGGGAPAALPSQPLAIRVWPSSAEPAPASDLSHLSDDDLLRALGASVPAGPPSVVARFEGSPVMSSSADAPASLRPLQEALQARADERLIGKPSGTNDALSAILNAMQGATLNIGGNAAAWAATIAPSLGIPGYSPRSFGENYERFRNLFDAHSRQSPKSALAGTVGGAVLTAPLMPGLGIASKPAASIGGRALQYGTLGGIYGAAAEALDSKDPLKAAGAGGAGFAGGAVLGPAAEKLAPPVVNLAMRAVAPAAERLGYAISKPAGGFSIEAEQALRSAGLEPAQLPASLASEMQRAFAAKGASPAVVREAQAAEFGIPLSRAQATGDPAAIRLEQGAISGARGHGAQAVAQDFLGRQGEAVLSAQDLINRVIAGARTPIANPTAAAEGVTAAARRIGDDYAFRAAAAQRGADQALEAVRGHGLPPDTLDAAALASQAARDAAARSREAYKGAYADVAAIPGTFTPGALDRMGSRVRDRIGAELPIDDVLTPSATRALRDLDALPDIFGLEAGQGPDLRQVDQLRKRLVAYRQNPTDRAVMDRILGEFDEHVHDAMDVGLFGQQAAPTPAAPAAAVDDGFPGFALAGLPEPNAPVDRAPESLMRFLAKNGGVPLDAETRAADLHKTYVPGTGTLARRDAPSWDDLRVRLSEAGYLPPDEQGYARAEDLRDWVLDAIHQERIGRGVRFRLEDEAHGLTKREAERIADENADFAVRLDHQSRQMLNELNRYGLRSADVDKDILKDAAASMLRGEVDDAAEAYDRAVAHRVALERGGGGVSPAADAPFPEPGQRGASAAGDAFPVGDTSPSDAMKNARGLFRAHQQAFRPRGPGDTAGRNLQKIVERDATPNEVASMLFGGATGRVTGRQLETLDRLRDVVGTDSDAWRAVQQATIGKYLEGRDVGRSLDYLLRGEGRELANRVLTPQQRAGLDAFRTGTVQAENARAAVPEWVSDLAKGGYDSNRVLGDLFGSTVPGARRPAPGARRPAGAGALWARPQAVSRRREPGMVRPSAGGLADADPARQGRRPALAAQGSRAHPGLHGRRGQGAGDHDVLGRRAGADAALCRRGAWS